jgi:hypothetical protein
MAALSAFTVLTRLKLSTQKKVAVSDSKAIKAAEMMSSNSVKPCWQRRACGTARRGPERKWPVEAPAQARRCELAQAR